MCLAVPGKILRIEGDTAEIDFGGVIRKANVTMVEAEVGKWAVIHAGFAIEIMDEEEARETLKLWNEFLSSEGTTFN
ncbi:MAG: HypC/HybG/HupF family hydrogenase formation chaperone [Euryarchaeota archaeon]|jgi:hydrogenase expression/formation protein HypC|nr:HypC/HybG/HupF family hydrogenase formation chaperone [Euryarchaeota archaeon]